MKKNLTDGEKLLKLRNAIDINQTDFSKILNISQSAISYIERDHRTLSKQLKRNIIEYFNFNNEFFTNIDIFYREVSNLENERISEIRRRQVKQITVDIEEKTTYICPTCFKTIEVDNKSIVLKLRLGINGVMKLPISIPFLPVLHTNCETCKNNILINISSDIVDDLLFLLNHNVVSFDDTSHIDLGFVVNINSTVFTIIHKYKNSFIKNWMKNISNSKPIINRTIPFVLRYNRFSEDDKKELKMFLNNLRNDYEEEMKGI